MTKASNAILVHGAWADGSSWSKVIPLLLNGGLRVTAVQLPLISLKDDVATVNRAIALEDGPIILVGHSYGGVVITEAGDDPKDLGSGGPCLAIQCGAEVRIACATLSTSE
jgi:pimeloyl-ACP methyl ester carboxylesterase